MSSSEQPFVQAGVIDGKAVAATIREEIAATVRQLKEKHGKVGELHSLVCCSGTHLRAVSMLMHPTTSTS